MKRAYITGGVALGVVIALSISTRVRQARAADMLAQQLHADMAACFAKAGPMSVKPTSSEIRWYQLSVLATPTDAMRELPEHVKQRSTGNMNSGMTHLALTLPTPIESARDTSRRKGLLSDGEKGASPYMNGWLGRRLSGKRDADRSTGFLGINPYKRNPPKSSGTNPNPYQPDRSFGGNEALFPNPLDPF